MRYKAQFTALALRMLVGNTLLLLSSLYLFGIFLMYELGLKPHFLVYLLSKPVLDQSFITLSLPNFDFSVWLNHLTRKDNIAISRELEALT